jgi:hypothetical protein
VAAPLAKDLGKAFLEDELETSSFKFGSPEVGTDVLPSVSQTKAHNGQHIECRIALFDHFFV